MEPARAQGLAFFPCGPGFAPSSRRRLRCQGHAGRTPRPLDPGPACAPRTGAQRRGPGPQPGPGTETKADPQEWIRPYAGYLPGVDEEKHSIFLVRDAISRRPIQGAVVTRHVESAAEMRPTDESPPTRVAEPGVCIEITLPTRR